MWGVAVLQLQQVVCQGVAVSLGSGGGGCLQTFPHKGMRMSLTSCCIVEVLLGWDGLGASILELDVLLCSSVHAQGKLQQWSLPSPCRS